MHKFKSYLNECVLLDEAAGKNTHMEHIEDEIFNNGVTGTRNAINFLRDLRDTLSGHTNTPTNITVKWDGAPAIFIGIDPTDDKFFVAKKGIFNKNPILYKSVKDIKTDDKLPVELKKSFETAFTEFSKFGIKKGVYQGDLMFTKDSVKLETIDGEKYYTFQPNTIVYAVPASSDLGKEIKRAKIGVVWHTTYTGSSIESLIASFGKSIVNKFRHPPTVWMDDATYKDVSGTANFTVTETQEINVLLSQAGSIFRTIKGDVLRLIQNDEELKAKIKTYNNTYVRAGEAFPNPSKHVIGLIDYLTQWYQKEIDKRSSESGKEIQKNKRDDLIEKIRFNQTDLIRIFELMNILIKAKQMIINKLNQAGHMRTFLRTNKGFKTTKQEGYVAIDHIRGAVKLVDRLEFSLANFSPNIIKGWQR